MEKILFDLKGTQPTKSTKIHGGGRYGEMVLMRIMERGLEVHCCYDSKKWLNPVIMTIIKENNVPLYDISQNNLREIMSKNGINRFYMPVYFETPSYLQEIDTKQCQIFTTIHDLRNLELPMDYYRLMYKPWKNGLTYLKRLLFKSRYNQRDRQKILNAFQANNMHIVTVTNHSAFSFKSFFPELKNVDVPVFYAPSTIKMKAEKIKYLDKFFLLVSCNRFNKNNLRAIIALDRLFSMGYAIDYKVKLTGVESLHSFRYNFQNPNKFECCGFVEERELNQLYHDAYCFIFPSLQEGFGYPPVEAMFYGTPVLSSPFSSISEICGNSVIYFNPFSIEEIMNRILMILNPNIHQKYSKLAKQRCEEITQKQIKDLDGLIDYIYGL